MTFVPANPIPAFGVFAWNLPATIVVVISIAVGYLMVILFGYTSNQKAIKKAKDRLKANLLAVRLFQDQIGVVVRSYGGIIGGTGRYIALAFKPLLFVIIPLTLVMIQMDRYLGFKPLETDQPFLIKVRTANSDALNDTTLKLPSELKTTAPAVRAMADHEIVWRVEAQKNGKYDVAIESGGQSYTKKIVVGQGLERLSPIRLRGQFWERLLYSSESALPDSSPVQVIEVKYPARNVSFAGVEENWIVAFFILSLVAGFIFKSALGIEI